MTNTNNTQKAINGNCKAVRCTTDGSYYHSVKEAAIANGVTFQAMSYAIRKNKPCKGKEFSFESKVEANMMKMASNLEAYRAKAIAYDRLMAEKRAEEERLERVRQIKKAHELKIAKAKEKVGLYEAECERRTARLKLAQDKLMAAQIELEALMDQVVV